MPIEIKVLKQIGKVPAGTYTARYLASEGYVFLQALNPCREAQIITGAHSGEILPYSAFIVTGELPAQADLLQVKEKLIDDLAAAGRMITENARKIGLLQELKETLEEQKARLAERVKDLEKTNRELNAQLAPRELSLETHKEIRRDVGQIVWEWWSDPISFGDQRSHVQNLATKLSRYVEERNAPRS